MATKKTQPADADEQQPQRSGETIPAPGPKDPNTPDYQDVSAGPSSPAEEKAEGTDSEDD